MRTLLTNTLDFISRTANPNPHKVIFLGAGASKDAGYPLTSELLNSLEEKSSNTSLVKYKTDWDKFDQSLKKIKSNYPEFTSCTDIEHLLTIVSLLQKRHENASTFDNIEQARDVAYRETALENSSLASEYEAAKRRFARCAEFVLSNIDYFMESSSYSYLLTLFKKLLPNNGTIITTNYDILAERCLYDLKKWNAHDGYGFFVNFENKDSGDDQNEDIEQYNTSKSAIKIFKLHGSVGWLNDKNRIVLETTRLKHLIRGNWKDRNYSPVKHDDKHLILPDFLKSFENSTMIDIWMQAQQAILNTNEVHIFGFSLPEYDGNIRTLLLPLREKLLKKTCEVKVYILDNDEYSQERWENHLTNKIEIIRYESLKKYYERYS